ncbi:hypothetical protein [uncultured Ferrimonas sp.]|uniref:hypothetical protein n=1 Tax=uncultured Ferrimonas sp. TaxID=432640 RepID=UPI00261D8D4B|nr:hypothetical protein [uncultured Ferrimonas sp.]
MSLFSALFRWLAPSTQAEVPPPLNHTATDDPFLQDSNYRPSAAALNDPAVVSGGNVAPIETDPIEDIWADLGSSSADMGSDEPLLMGSMGISDNEMSINPSTGLPMLDGIGSVDVGGNAFGCGSDIGVSDGMGIGIDDGFSASDCSSSDLFSSDFGSSDFGDSDIGGFDDSFSSSDPW